MNRPTTAALGTGLALTVLATVVPYVDRATSHRLADHVRAGYPDYSRSRIDTAVTAWLVILTIVGVLGVVGWLSTAYAVRAGSRWAPACATAAFVAGLGVALTDLLIRDTSGETGLPALIGWAGVLPCVPGLVAVVLLWRRA